MSGGIRLATPYRDTSADQLRFTLTGPRRPALAVTDAELDGFTVQLRLLGASHQVLAGPVSETLACLPAEPGEGPPHTVRRDIDGWRYAFDSTVTPLPADQLSARAAALRARLAHRPAALHGTFPGSPDALTGLLTWRAGRVVNWRTWHVYPQAGQVVATETRLEMP
ncbi:Protein of unknown function DUF2617 [Streptomyces zhaozhouensis]|uniref:DUF2617 domain-containing protein n=1 Tax=Streptomyces zhaozhouensis TaxID=1300267 RepID=A0A286E7F2_9ACTN|nr:DUF2617 family protein [Streptomyces zhaozhouensis]SOD66784.1 Protein of unknown function DUF2617 [Streptomyces zhaozhouensis]